MSRAGTLVSLRTEALQEVPLTGRKRSPALQDAAWPPPPASFWSPRGGGGGGLSRLPGITAVTEEQAVLPVTVATDLAKGGVLVLILVLSGSGALHRDLEADSTAFTWQSEPRRHARPDVRPLIRDPSAPGGHLWSAGPDVQSPRRTRTSHSQPFQGTIPGQSAAKKTQQPHGKAPSRARWRQPRDGHSTPRRGCDRRRQPRALRTATIKQTRKHDHRRMTVAAAHREPRHRCSQGPHDEASSTPPDPRSSADRPSAVQVASAPCPPPASPPPESPAQELASAAHVLRCARSPQGTCSRHSSVCTFTPGEAPGPPARCHSDLSPTGPRPGTARGPCA